MKRSLSRGLLGVDGVAGGDGAIGVSVKFGIVGAPMRRENRLRRASSRPIAGLGEDAVAVEDGEENRDMDAFGFIFLGVDGIVLAALAMQSLSRGRRLRRRRRWGRDGHGLVGEIQSSFCSGM